jgi:hypothetical protein
LLRIIRRGRRPFKYADLRSVVKREDDAAGRKETTSSVCKASRCL